jgi:7,8-dihydropterin-6-yl-methyl-4-(beta-D-ribofuranosyl)aminobenzene 5'-phosphate synthase
MTTMSIKITTLVENAVAQGGKALLGEHGLSFYIEAGDRRILFDTGQNLAISNNARVLGVDLEQIDTVVLSHGHYDHSGGLQSLMERNRHFTFYGHPDVFSPKFRKNKDGYKYIGIPVEKDDFVNRGISLQLDRNPIEIAPGVMTSGEIALENDFERVEANFFLKQDQAVIADTLADDQALILDTRHGVVVLLGCSHRGVVNTLTHVARLKNARKIHAIIGGLHLGKASDGQVSKIIDHLRGFGLEMVVIGHCTGPRAFLALANEFQDRALFNTVGTVMKF